MMFKGTQRYCGKETAGVMQEGSTADAGLNHPKIIVVTFLDAHNYGTVFQALATRDLLAAYGDPVFVDCVRPDHTLAGWVDARLRSTRNVLLKPFAPLAAAPGWVEQTRLFHRFVEKQLDTCPLDEFLSSKSYGSNAVYVAGSDQIWNSSYNFGMQELYYLSGAPEGCMKVALSASFGRKELPDCELVEIAPLLRRFDAISVREKSGLAILESLGIRGGRVLKDPVLLCRPELWDGVAPRAAALGGGYVYVYALGKDPRMISYARGIARERGLKVKYVTFNRLRPAPRGAETVCLPTPEEWVSLIRDAAYVITDSFHGVCFSLVFEREFTAFDPARFSVRISDLLTDFGLSEREVSANLPAEEVRVHDLPVDWVAVREAKARFRAEGREFLDECFG